MKLVGIIGRSYYNKDNQKIIQTHKENTKDYVHNINIIKDSILYKMLNKETIKVNSLHKHYAEDDINNLLPCAYSSDGILEAVYYPNKKFILGLQWHPEHLMDDNSKKIFDAFRNSLY